MTDDWQAEQYRDECELQKAALEALQAAKALGLPEDKLMTLAYIGGVANEFYRTTHNLERN